MANTALTLRGLILTAADLRQLQPDWPSALIEDYLNILNNLILLADVSDTKSGIVKNIVTVTTSPYSPVTDDEIIFCNTDVQPITIQLPEGIEGNTYRIINAGSSGSNVTIAPFLGETIFNESSQFLVDAEVLDIAFNESKGWY